MGGWSWLGDGSYVGAVLIAPTARRQGGFFVPGFSDGRRWLDGLWLASEKDWPADVAELVDARDLKSLSYGYPGSIPGVRTRLYLWLREPAVPGPFGM